MAEKAPLEFYFDFSSPYGYFAAAKIDDLAAGGDRGVIWRPILLGVVFQTTGAVPLTHMAEPKASYFKHDWERLGRQMDVPFKLPSRFPIPTQAAARAFYWLDDKNPELARLFAKAAFHAFFAEDIDISNPETVADIAAGLHVKKEELLAAIADPKIKQRLKDENEAAIEKGVFGSPFIFVDGEGFWGCDRMWMVKKWMKGIGW